jgi:hypothetical protein
VQESRKKHAFKPELNGRLLKLYGKQIQEW